MTGVYPTPEKPALGSFVAIQADSLRKRGVAVSVLHLEGGRGVSKYAKGVLELRRRLAKERCDLVHGFYIFSGLVALTQSRCPTVVTYLGDEAFGTPGPGGRPTKVGSLGAKLSRWALPRFGRVIVQSRRMHEALGGGDMEILPFGIDFDLFHPVPRAECRARLGLRQDKRYLLFANDKNLPVKRYDFAEKAVSLLPKSLDVEILTLWNRVPAEEMAFYYGAVDALILTSAHEGSPTVVKEALACNTPIVTVDVGDVSENLRGVANCQVTAHNAQDFARAIERVLGGKGGSDGRQKSRHLSAPVIADRLITIYGDVLAKAGKRLRS